MFAINPLRTKVLITTDEVVFHAPVEHNLDPRVILQNIVLAERRFVKPMLCPALYQELIDEKNLLVTDANRETLTNTINAGRASDREPLVLKNGHFVNSDTYLSADQLILWQDYLHKIVAECVYFVSLPVNRARFTSTGVMKNSPDTIAQFKDSATIDLRDLKHLMDEALQDRINPLIEDMHAYLCANIGVFTNYCKDCSCDSDGHPLKIKRGQVVFGLYGKDTKHVTTNGNNYSGSIGRHTHTTDEIIGLQSAPAIADYEIGVTVGAPVEGETTWTPTGIGSVIGAGSVEFFLNGGLLRQSGTTPEVVINTTTGEITVAMAFASVGWVHLKIYEA